MNKIKRNYYKICKHSNKSNRLLSNLFLLVKKEQEDQYLAQESLSMLKQINFIMLKLI
jgi:hypothetical protein